MHVLIAIKRRPGPFPETPPLQELLHPGGLSSLPLRPSPASTGAQNGAMQHFAAIICVKNYYMMFATNSARPASRLWYFLAPPGSTSRPMATPSTTPLALIRRELSPFCRGYVMGVWRFCFFFF